MKKVIFSFLVLWLVVSFSYPLSVYSAQESTGFSKFCRSSIVRLALGVGALGTGLWGLEEYNKDPETMVTSTFVESDPSQKTVDLVIIGDSLAAGKASDESSGIVSYILESRWTRLGGWGLDDDPEPHSVLSVIERFESEGVPARVTIRARSGAYVDKASVLDRTAANFVRNINNLSGQVDRVISSESFPNLIFIHIGHNNMDWFYDLQSNPDLDKDHHLSVIPTRVGAEILKQVERLVTEAERRSAKTEIVVFGLVDFASCFSGRTEAHKLKLDNPSLYPAFDSVHVAWPSAMSQHQKTTVELGEKTNRLLRQLVSQSAESASDRTGGRVRLRYSSAFYDIDFSNPANLHPADAFHPSTEGHEKLSRAAFGEVRESIIWNEVVKRQ